MPIVSGGGGGGGGPAAGSYLPVANKTGVTVDTTTYDNVLEGSGKMTTLVFPDSFAPALAMAIIGDAFPRWVFGGSTGQGIFLSDGTVEPTQNGANIRGGGTSNLTLDASGSSGTVSLFGTAQVDAPTTPLSPPRMSSMSPRFTITSGALPTVAPVSGTAFQVSTTRDAQLVVPVTYNPGVATTATCKVELSADNSTFTEVVTVTKPVGTVFDGQIDPVDVRVPAGWYVKLTVVNATLGTGTYY